MLQSAYTDALTSAADELTVEVATTPQQAVEAKRLRYQVYCEERNFEPGANGLEQDEYDDASQHVLVRSRASGKVYGTVRLVLSGQGGIDLGFPMERVCDDYVLRPLLRQTTAEVSRFAITRDRDGLSPAAAALMRLCLIRGIVQASGELGLTHWCATMERTLLRLLRSTAIHFEAVGPLIEYHGLRQPAVWELNSGFARIYRELPHVWAFLTHNGAFWPDATIKGRGTFERLARKLG
ncbi:N-acyl amino acid synthase FeeM domain-containing protein [Muricoccus radiodurans]|uniref:N-acyl amino acid synthase FeeM domain-containing protein n=1 Tax=Muricoccus radiodurans TaxID=2231721 RepID=UPI003CF85AC4